MKTLVEAVGELHNIVYDSDEAYRGLFDPRRATPADERELDALHELREWAIVYANSNDDELLTFIGKVIALTSTDDLREALHKALLVHGLGGSREAGERHVAAVREQVGQLEEAHEEIRAAREEAGLDPNPPRRFRHSSSSKH